MTDNAPGDATATVTVRIENTYSDGHSSTEHVTLPAPNEADLDEFWEDEVFEYTGDGHGIDSSLGSYYEATITAGPEHLVGKTYSWGG